MKLSRFLVSLMLLVALPAMALTDSQVIAYIQTQVAAGKSQDEIGKELLAKGVTPEQIKRIRAQYDKTKKSRVTSGAQSNVSSKSRMRQEKRVNSASTNASYATVVSEDGDMLFDDDMMYDRRMGTGRMNDGRYVVVSEPTVPGKVIYGHDVFSSALLSFEPNNNMATPQDYRLGPGDEVIIDIWGASEDNIRGEISPDGKITISKIGPVYLNGMTVAEANRHIKNIFSRKYAGVGTDTDINLSLGNIRSIQVDVMGEVSTPGSFRLSPFSNVFHAIYSAGGINEIGTLRNIQVMRNGKVISKLDLYDYLFKGKDTGNIRLQEGDVIIVPPYSELVNVVGNVKRPMFYELKPNESLAKLLEYAGGFSGDAYNDAVKVERLNGSEKIIFTVDKEQYPTLFMIDGDEVTIGEVTNLYTNRVEIRGSVRRPGTYAISNEIQSVKELINSADGLTEDAYLDKALIYRERPDRSLEVISVNIGDLMDGVIADMPLNKNDIIHISNVNELIERGGFTINGYVRNPGNYPYAAGTTIDDLILQAGGLLEGASTARVEVARRIVDQDATVATNQIAQMFTFSIGENADPQYKNFTLKPYDVVHIRKSPTYKTQEFVTVNGQVLFPGQYTLQSRNERISEVIKRTGGLLDAAYVKGAFLKRRIVEDTKEQQIEALKNASREALKEIDDPELLALQQEQDAQVIDKLQSSTHFSVGIDLQKAIDNPGSTYDFVLMNGDILEVPELQSTVQISGEVLYPNSVVFVPGKKIKYYIEQAGGYGEEAKKSKAFIVYMNGSVAKAKGSTIVEPGSHIIVPAKNKKQFDWTPILSTVSVIGSLATMAATVVALTK